MIAPCKPRLSTPGALTTLVRQHDCQSKGCPSGSSLLLPGRFGGAAASIAGHVWHLSASCCKPRSNLYPSDFTAPPRLGGKQPPKLGPSSAQGRRRGWWLIMCNHECAVCIMREGPCPSQCAMSHSGGGPMDHVNQCSRSWFLFRTLLARKGTHCLPWRCPLREAPHTPQSQRAQEEHTCTCILRSVAGSADLGWSNRRSNRWSNRWSN